MTKKNNKFNKTMRNRGTHTKKWMTAIEAAQNTLSETGSLQKAKRALKLQALTNARRMFGSIGRPYM
jgi:hypothetical protein